MKVKSMEIESTLSEKNVADDRLNVPACFQCRRCTNGCPVTFAMDIYPDKVIRLVNLGQMERVLNCSTLWICASCETCTTRCPNNVDIAGVMDFLKELALKQGIKPPEHRSLAFHEAFFRDIEKRGRIFEGGMMQSYLIRSGDLFKKTADGSILEDISLGLKMLLKGRMPLLPHGIKGKKEVRELMKK
jgi:heterodisulfide reductase subunit C